MNTQVQKIEPAETLPAAAQPQATTILQVIERAAQNPNVDIDKMERLLQMHERLVAREAKAEFDSELALMQDKLPVIERHGKITVRKKGPTGDRDGEIQQATAYALWEDINEAIKPILAEHGFALSFRVGLAGDGKITVTGILSHKAGHREETTITLPHDSTGSKNAVQAVGSSTSYGKRYTAMALLNLTSRGEDDDGKDGGKPALITDEQRDELGKMLDETGGDLDKFLAYFKIEYLADLPAARFADAVVAIRKVAENRKKEGAPA